MGATRLGTTRHVINRGLGKHVAMLSCCVVCAAVSVLICGSAIADERPGSDCFGENCKNIPFTKTDPHVEVTQIPPVTGTCQVGLGRAIVLKAPAGKIFYGSRVIIGSDSVCDVDVPDTGSNHVAVRGKKLGKTTVTLFYKDKPADETDKNFTAVTYLLEVLQPADTYASLEKFINECVLGTEPERDKYSIELIPVPTAEGVIARGKVKDSAQAKMLLAIIGRKILPELIVDKLTAEGLDRTRGQRTPPRYVSPPLPCR